MSDFQKRRTEVMRELTAEQGDDVLIVDWTMDAAARCGAPALFNAMDGGRRLLVSCLTSSCGPYEVQPLILDLARRGVCAKVVYVDDECCGAWSVFLHNVSPGVYVRL